MNVAWSWELAYFLEDRVHADEVAGDIMFSGCPSIHANFLCFLCNRLSDSHEIF